MSHRVAVIGGGHMGRALVAGIRGRLPAQPVLVVETDAERRRRCAQEFAVDVAETYDPQPGDTVIIAVPPHNFRQFSADHEDTIFDDCLVISVMAGVGLNTIERSLGTGTVIRSIPNTPSEVGYGMTVLCAAPAVQDTQLQSAVRLLSAVGCVLVVEDENLLHDATALCGGGPAFVAEVVGAFVEFARSVGFDEQQARLMACQVMYGTARLIEVSHRAPEEIAEEVMTAGGTTERGVAVLRDRAVRAAFLRCLEHAADRSRELGTDGSTRQPAGGLPCSA